MINLMKFVCALRQQHKERMRRYKREDRSWKAERERQQGWKDLYDHMSRTSARAGRLTIQPVSLTAREAAAEARRTDTGIQSVEESIEAHGVLPLARPARLSDL